MKIITDSTADIPPQVADKLGIHVVPLYVHFGSEVYRDGVDLSPAEFYAKLAASKTLPTTSTISPGEFAQIYDTLAEQTDEILAIVLSAELSATHEAALQGRNLRQKTNCRVEVIDSRLVTIAMGLVVIAAAKQAAEGAGIDRVMNTVRHDIAKVQIRVAFD
ncbi:MAG: DegV family EDD domain-containing protein, partial [Chloroflexi bacterium]|nr:DegV family EDD domain-containing protein [Chloroflexota bacterium]